MTEEALRAELRTTIRNMSNGQLSFGMCEYITGVLFAKYDITPKKPVLSDRDAIRRYYQAVRDTHPSQTLLDAVNQAEAEDERLWND